MKVASLDHLVLTVASIAATEDFYTRVLGMEAVVSENGRHALKFGRQKINLHERGHEFDPKAWSPTPGSGDLCFLTEIPVAEFAAHLRATGVEIVEGPVERDGAQGKLRSVYCRDPDRNLVEVSNLL